MLYGQSGGFVGVVEQHLITVFKNFESENEAVDAVSLNISIGLVSNCKTTIIKNHGKKSDFFL